MTDELPIRLKVSGKDEFRGAHAISTSFRFHGWLRLDAASLHIEWSGHAQVQDVGPLSVRDERLPLPRESLIVPVARLRRAELVGGWWRTRLAISARDGQLLALVPSEDQGTVHFWCARRDRKTAAAFAGSLSKAITDAAGEGLAPITHMSDSTPVTPPAV
jgi:hypothetical protein